MDGDATSQEPAHRLDARVFQEVTDTDDAFHEIEDYSSKDWSCGLRPES